MKVSVGLILLLGAVVVDVCAQKPRRDESYPPPQYLARFKITHEICKEKSGATDDAIKEFSDGELHEVDDALKCYMNCLFHEINVVDDDGEMHLAKLRNYVPDDLMEIVKPMLDACNEPVGETQCERAWWWHQCWKTNDPADSSENSVYHARK